MWAVVGAVLAAGLDVLPLLLVAGWLALLVGWLHGGSGQAEGMLTGAGLPFLYVAYINRGGTSFSPWPWLVIGAALVPLGIVLYRRSRHQRPGVRPRTSV